MPKILKEWLGYCTLSEIEKKTGRIKHHNKWWACCIMQDDDQSYRVHTLYAALEQNGSEHIKRYNKQGAPLLAQEASQLFDALVQEKQHPKKGYQKKSFDVPFGTPTSIIVPSFTQRFSSTTILVPAVSPSSVGTIACFYCSTMTPLQEAFCINCGLSLTNNSSHPPTLLLGALSGGYCLKQDRYTIEAKVGSGGMGEIYKAIDHDFASRSVAIKELVPDQRLNAQQLQEANEAFKQEAMLLAPLSHQSLPRIYDHFVESGRSYLVMDFIEGETLEHILEEAPNNRLPIKRVLSIGIALCDVLDYLHTRTPPIIFRDLKPANVMITMRNHVYLIDFGIARHFKAGQQKDTIAFGSPGYAAPEQYGKAQSLPRTDVYGLGATLHHAVTGFDPSVSPFHFASFPLDVEQVSGLEDLVLGMVKLNVAERRPANAAKVKAALQTMMSTIK